MSRVARLVRLDEAEAQDPALVGAKASRLATARARGLPVLNGLVIPLDVSLPVVRAGEAALRSTDNSGAARSAVYNHPPPSLLRDAAQEAQRLGNSLVVRSSSQAEAQGIWAGAFSSYLGVRPEELVRGVMGCWASVFSPGTLKRGEVTGIPPLRIGMAVLIQPEIRPTCGGVATLTDDGAVTVAGVLGHPAGLVAGWETGRLAIVDARGEVRGDASPLGSRLLGEIADLTRATAEKIRCNHIEWMVDHRGTVHLVQAQPKVDTRLQPTDRPAPEPAPRMDPWTGDAVRMMIRYPGPVGERLIWPWAIGLEDLSPARNGQTRRSVATLIAEVREGAALLTSQRWGGNASPVDLDRAWSALRVGDALPLRDLVARHRRIDRRLAADLLRNLRESGQALTAAGVIPHSGWIWHLDPDNLRRPHSGEQSPIRRVGATNWDAWIYSVIDSRGERMAGVPAAGGWGAGRVRFIHDAEDAARFSPREVIATSVPVGNLAPLLWNAAGLITAEGSPGAHLFEVAEWLAVPALCGVDISRWTGDDPENPLPRDGLIVAVNGDRGHITRLPRKT